MIVSEADLRLDAYNRGSPFHRASSRWWSTLLSGAEPVGLCPVVVFAFLRRSTSGRVFERPLAVEEASGLIASWLAQPNVRLLVAGSNHVETVCRLLASAGSGGNLVTDAQVAALGLEYDATVHTADTDLGRLPGVSWKNPLRR